MEFAQIVSIMTLACVILAILLIFAFRRYNSMVKKLVNSLKDDNSDCIRKINRLTKQIDMMKSGYITARIRGVRDYNNQTTEVVILPDWLFDPPLQLKWLDYQMDVITPPIKHFNLSRDWQRHENDLR